MGTFWLAPKMDPSASVDDQLWVLRVQNLRVIVASIMPTMPSVKLNAGVLVISENASELVLENPPI